MLFCLREGINGFDLSMDHFLGFSIGFVLDLPTTLEVEIP